MYFLLLLFHMQRGDVNFNLLLTREFVSALLKQHKYCFVFVAHYVCNLLSWIVSEQHLSVCVSMRGAWWDHVKISGLTERDQRRAAGIVWSAWLSAWRLGLNLQQTWIRDQRVFAYRYQNVYKHKYIKTDGGMFCLLTSSMMTYRPMSTHVLKKASRATKVKGHVSNLFNILHKR